MEDNTPSQLPPTPPNTPKPVENKKLVAGLCALMVGTFGVHKFVLGYNTEGTIMLVINLVMLIITVVTCGFGVIITGPIMGLIGVLAMIEGIVYLTKSDEEFYQTYQVNKKPWF
jgi:TM2 domain-containing membrane protein YozV